MIPWILTDTTLTVVINGKSLTMEQSHPSFALAKEALASEEWEKLEELLPHVFGEQIGRVRGTRTP